VLFKAKKDTVVPPADNLQGSKTLLGGLQSFEAEVFLGRRPVFLDHFQ
jgi:hypothetical protein